MPLLSINFAMEYCCDGPAVLARCDLDSPELKQGQKVEIAKAGSQRRGSSRAYIIATEGRKGRRQEARGELGDWEGSIPKRQSSPIQVREGNWGSRETQCDV
jgi:hypothetical protein